MSSPAHLASPAPRAAAFTLSVTIPTFASPVLATRPPSAGTGQPSPRLFRQIASLPNLLGHTPDLTAAYLTQFPAPPAEGMKVAVQILPVTGNGFCGNPFTQIATVQAP